ncbi:MAG: response regulator [Gammaproteobacteria bacterium]|nr:response regulator [Gammaproteobacteria bacterium]MCP5316387.1 response regulator [Chromatiaceae bacterium]MCW5586138.1 response regulator [Chromatiales bacterium]MCB1818593.1 response regulator [Gammaproteobacteria bacterium]MCP5429345.1 response regulator [Chromatiaceae bacterium]
MDSARILLAEDEAITAAIIEDLLQETGVQVTTYADGRDAWEHLQTGPEAYDAILLDRGLPHMDGMDLLRRIKETPVLAHTPVIMQTAMKDQASMQEGLAEGAYYYLTKPLQPELLLAVVKSALQQTEERREMLESVRCAERPLDLLTTGTFCLRSLDECRVLAGYLARACPQPERAVQGLQELLINAVEHGNLGISYAEKSALILKDAWESEVRRRLDLPQYRERNVEVIMRRAADAVVFTIRDQGEGFDWRDYLEFSSDRAFDTHGRGIAMACKLSFSSVEYRGNGNTVVARIDHVDGGPER